MMRNNTTVNAVTLKAIKVSSQMSSTHLRAVGFLSVEKNCRERKFNIKDKIRIKVSFNTQMKGLVLFTFDNDNGATAGQVL